MPPSRKRAPMRLLRGKGRWVPAKARLPNRAAAQRRRCASMSAARWHLQEYTRWTPGSRVEDAVEAAGGLAEGAAPDALNLARPLADGEQVIVPTLEEVEQSAAAGSALGAASGAGGASPASGKVNLNTAGADELDALPGIGPATAEKIVADRQSNGPFADVEDLKRVSGIGDKKFAQLVDLVCVG